MRDELKDYILQLDISSEQKNRYIERFERNTDIADEFGRWLVEKRFFSAEDSGVVVNGWTSLKIAEASPMLSPLGVFNFLVDLRENPEAAQDIINDGFKTK